MSSTRQLAAIMFTDIVGYTALMGKDEQKAFELLRKNREIHKPLIKQFHGTWIKELGDGVLASFHTVTDAVFCAAAIHQACNKVERFQLRIGIHLGEVIFENKDVFGDGVNIASRLQAMASPGTTWVSEAVYKNLVNKKEITSEFVREETLKNVSEPVKVYEITVREIPGYLPDNTKAYQKQNEAGGPARKKTIFITAIVLLAGLGAAYFLFFNKQSKQLAANKQITEKSIAVLYFENMSGDPNQEYISDGVTEEIITHISKIKNIRVINSPSVRPFKGKPIDLKKITAELNVDFILSGNVRRSGNTIRITPQLIDAFTNRLIWTDNLDREMKDIFEVQGDIAKTIAQKLEIEITPEVNAKISEAPTKNIEAYEQFQKGKFFMYKKYFNTQQYKDFEKAKIFFEEAIKLDSGYAEAYAGLAEVYDELRNTYIANKIEFPEELLELKISLARKGLQLKPNSSYVNSAMAWGVINRPKPNFDSGYFFLKKAYYLDPADPVTSGGLGWTLSQSFGLHSIAIPFLLKAIKEDPLSPHRYVLLGEAYGILGKYTEAKKAFQKSIDLTDEQFKLEGTLLKWLAFFGEFDQAEKRLAEREGAYLFARSIIQAAKGEVEKITPDYRNHIFILLVINQNKVLKDVIKRLETEIDKGNNSSIYSYDALTTLSYFDAYREDADFKRILAKAKKNHEVNLAKYGNVEISD